MILYVGIYPNGKPGTHILLGQRWIPGKVSVMAQELRDLLFTLGGAFVSGTVVAAINARQSGRNQEKVSSDNLLTRHNELIKTHDEFLREYKLDIDTRIKEFRTELGDMKRDFLQAKTELADCQTDRVNLHIEVDKLKETIIRYERMGKASHHVADWNTEPLT